MMRFVRRLSASVAPLSFLGLPTPVAHAQTLAVSDRAEPGPAISKPEATVALSGAAIAALIVKQSRSAYYATGRPCACPDDLTRSGRSCGASSAYSRPGGASPKCYPSDVSEREIEDVRAQLK